jgi:hypothetical protein
LASSLYLSFSKHSSKIIHWEDEGYQPPQEVIFGGSSTDGPQIEKDNVILPEIPFLYDSEVGTKFRGTTFYKSNIWSETEERQLTSLVKKFGHNWKQIALKMLEMKDPLAGVKDNVACSRRWNILKRRKFEWTQQTNDLLLNLVSEKGSKWKVFESYFNGCDNIQIKRQYYKLRKEGRLPTGLAKISKAKLYNFNDFQTIAEEPDE